MKVAGGMDINFKMTKVIVLEQKETPGIGSKVQKPEFTAQFTGVGPDGLALRSEGGQIDGISGATLSSKAVTNGVHNIVEQIQQEAS
ncbi:MAG: FMN-binding protein [Nitrospiraceae bacterium]|nr:FMN-binding protein [Nitrospiraceae bacterium]